MQKPSETATHNTVSLKDFLDNDEHTWKSAYNYINKTIKKFENGSFKSLEAKRHISKKNNTMLKSEDQTPVTIIPTDQPIKHPSEPLPPKITDDQSHPPSPKNWNYIFMLFGVFAFLVLIFKKVFKPSTQ